MSVIPCKLVLEMHSLAISQDLINLLEKSIENKMARGSHLDIGRWGHFVNGRDCANLTVISVVYNVT